MCRFACGGTGFDRFDGGGFAGVGRELVRGGCFAVLRGEAFGTACGGAGFRRFDGGGFVVSGRFNVGAKMKIATPTPALPRCGR